MSITPPKEGVEDVSDPKFAREDTFTLEDKISLLDKLQEVAKCPICLGLLCPPLWYCVNGHCICMACKGSLTTCPTCRGGNLHSAKNIILEDMLNCLPRPCRFHGCDFLNLEKILKLHEAGCSFRKVSCRVCDCSWEGKANSLSYHIQSAHPPIDMFKEESSVWWCNFKKDSTPTKTKSGFINSVGILKIFCTSAYDCIFWLYSKIDLLKMKFMILFICVPTANSVVNNFYSTVIFSSKNQPDFKFQFTQKVYNEDVEDTDRMFSETLMTIPLSATSHFINEDALCWSYKIFRMSST